MPPQRHVIVVGLGIVGSSITAALAAKGYRVTAVEQFAAGHERGSSHGDTRLFRRVPYEGSVFVKLAAQSYDGWRRWNQSAREDLFVSCGGFDAGPADSTVVQATLLFCQQSGRPYGLMSGESLNRRHPQFNLPSQWQVVSQAESGYVRPDATLAYLHQAARQSGARLMFETRLTQIEPGDSSITVHAGGETITGHTLILAAGGWLPKMVPQVARGLRTERRVTAWYRVPDTPLPEKFPVFALDADGGWYGLPTPRGDLKIGHDLHLGEHVDPDLPAHPPGDEDRTHLDGCIERYLRGFSPAPVSMKTCLYLQSSERPFIMDRHPEFKQVLIFSCAGGGFKYAPVYGDIALEFLEDRLRDELVEFRIDRDSTAALPAQAPPQPAADAADQDPPSSSR